MTCMIDPFHLNRMPVIHFGAGQINKLPALLKAKGETVEKMEVIATVGDTASMSGSNLYFEVRHYGRSMNPLKWLKQG